MMKQCFDLNRGMILSVILALILTSVALVACYNPPKFSEYKGKPGSISQLDKDSLIDVWPQSVDFGTVPIGDWESRQIRVTNRSSVKVEIEIDEDLPSAVFQLQDDCSGNLDPEEFCYLEIGFEPDSWDMSGSSEDYWGEIEILAIGDVQERSDTGVEGAASETLETQIEVEVVGTAVYTD